MSRGFWLLVLVVAVFAPIAAQTPATGAPTFAEATVGKPTSAEATAGKQLPKGQTPDRGRPTQHDDQLPLFDFDVYFLGNWHFEWDMPEGPLGPAGRLEGTTVYSAQGNGVYQAITDATGAAGKVSVTELIRYQKEQKTLTREVTDSRGYSYTQTGTIGGDLGGFYTIYFESAPFTVGGQSVRVKHQMRLTSPLNYRMATTVSLGDGPFVNYGTPWWRKEGPQMEGGLRR